MKHISINWDICRILCCAKAKPDPITAPDSQRHCLLVNTRYPLWTSTTLPSTLPTTTTSEYGPPLRLLSRLSAPCAAHSELTPEQLDEYEEVGEPLRATAHR